MKVRFNVEFGGRETKEIHYPPGFEVELDDEIGSDLVNRGICESLEPAPKPDVEPKKQLVSAAPTKKRGGK